MAQPKRSSAAPLEGQIAVVAGATRGAGRGIARALGEAGATVYCTGRSVAGTPSPYGRPETLDETVAMIAAAGGKAIAARLDHTVEEEVSALFDRVARDHGRLDVLADSVGGEDPLLGGWTTIDKTDLSDAGGALQGSLLSHLFTAKHAAKVMQKKKRGLIVEITEFDLLLGGGNIVNGMVKTGLKTLALLLAEELRKCRVTVVSLTPGYLRSERMLEHFGVTEATWRDGAKKDPVFITSESPLFIGRAVAALAADPRGAMEMSGHILSSWELARKYRFADADGTMPDTGAYFRDHVIPSMKWMREGIERQIDWLDALTGRARGYLAPASARTPSAARRRAGA